MTIRLLLLACLVSFSGSFGLTWLTRAEPKAQVVWVKPVAPQVPVPAKVVDSPRPIYRPMVYPDSPCRCQEKKLKAKAKKKTKPKKGKT